MFERYIMSMRKAISKSKANSNSHINLLNVHSVILASLRNRSSKGFRLFGGYWWLFLVVIGGYCQ